MKKSITNKMINEAKRDEETIIKNSSNELLDYLIKSLPDVSVDEIKKGLDLALQSYGIKRKDSSELQMLHTIEVVKILLDLRLDTTTIVAALLKDVLIFTELTTDELERDFGLQVSTIVQGLTKLNQIEYKGVVQEKTENLRKLLMAVAEDARVLLIKMADKLHNMQMLSCKGSDSQRMKFARESIDVYAPLAERIGMNYFKNSLYDLAFDALYPNIRQAIIEQVKSLKLKGYNNIRQIIKEIASVMKDNKLKVSVKGREKTPFSIWRKMEKKKAYFDDLSDIFAIRIITDNPIDCYLALGIVHINYAVVSKEFFDYVSTPKQNGYRSIHTVVLVSGIKVEIQIRTNEMHKISELGMAAHWVYKQQDDVEKAEYHNVWLQRIRSIISGVSDNNCSLSDVKLEMYRDIVFCFTVQGDIVALPKKATPLDFAFEVNSYLGSHYKKAVINERSVSMTTEIQSGDQVEIITADKPMISHHWLDIVYTTKAKNEIHAYLEKEFFEVSVLRGNLKLQEEYEKYHLELNNDNLKQIAKRNSKSIDNLLFEIGSGAITPEKIVKESINNSFFHKIKYFFMKLFSFESFSPRPSRTLNNLKYYHDIGFAYCCKPKINENALGVYDKESNTVILHSKNCASIANLVTKKKMYEVKLPEKIYDTLNTAIEITMLDYTTAEKIFSVFTEFGISKYTIDIKSSQKSSLIMKVNTRPIMFYQFEAAMNRIKNLSGVLDISHL